MTAESASAKIATGFDLCRRIPGSEPQARKSPNDRNMFECSRFRSIATFGQGERVTIGSLHLMKTEEFLHIRSAVLLGVAR